MVERHCQTQALQKSSVDCEGDGRLLAGHCFKLFAVQHIHTAISDRFSAHIAWLVEDVSDLPEDPTLVVSHEAPAAWLFVLR
jgi:hypothetical protein